MKRFLSGVLVLLMVACLFAGCDRGPEQTETPSQTTQSVPTTTAPVDYNGATVILYTANVRGDVSVYSAIAAARAAYEAEGATVYLVDAGNYLQGSVYASYDMGATIYQLMEAAGYDVAGLGVYDLVHGEAEVGYAAYGNLVKFYTQAELYRGTGALTYQSNASWAKEPIKVTRPAKAAAGFSVICSNISKSDEVSGYYDFDASVVLGDSLKVGFVSSLRQDAAEYLGDGFLNGYAFADVIKPQCDVLVSLGGGAGDIVIEAPADGTLAVGAYVIDSKSGRIVFEQVALEDTDAQMDGLIAAIEIPEVIGTVAHTLNGSAAFSCNGMSGMGLLVSNALKWYGENKLEGIECPVIGLFNGGNCRNFLYDGAITEADLRNAIHGSEEGVGVVYLSGLQLLEMLEAATQRENCAGWSYTTMGYSVARNTYYDAGEPYGLYYKVASINRVTITDPAFNPNATYAVVADMLLLKGEDTYYMLAEQEIAVRDATGADICQIVEMYIREALQGQVEVPQQILPNSSITVMLNPNGGTCNSASVNIVKGDRYGRLPVPVRDGYTFLGWFTATEGGERITEETVMTADGDHTLYAQWEVKTSFLITLDANGGRVSPYQNPIILKKGDKYGTLPEPVREGYKFLGWYTEAEGGQRVKSTTTFTLDEDQILYAHWEYDALAYWTFILENRVQQIPQWRRVVVYLERNAGYKTYIDCDFLDDAGAINPAIGLEEYKVTDEWIESVNPHIIVKLTTDTDMSLISKMGMLRRFPDADIYVFSTAAVSGNEKTQLYCRLHLAKLLYPEYFEDVDLDAVKAELKVKTTVYY